MTRRRIIDISLIAVIALLLLTPISSYVKRYLIPNNTIDIEAKEALSEESLTLELKGLNTKDLDLKDTKGKVTFLHFWGTWCPDCMLEMPTVQTFYDAQKDKLNFVLVEIEKDDSKYEKSVELLKKKGITIPIYKAKSLFSKQLQVTSFPTTFIIDAEGNIISKHEGATDWSKPEVQQQILDLVKE